MNTMHTSDHEGGVRVLTLDRPPAGKFEETVMRRAARLASNPREAYAHTKGMLVAEAVRCPVSTTRAGRPTPARCSASGGCLRVAR